MTNLATNGVPPSVSKRITIDVEFSPMIWVPNQLVGAPLGTDVQIDCHTEAHPKYVSINDSFYREILKKRVNSP